MTGFRRFFYILLSIKRIYIFCDIIYILPFPFFLRKKFKKLSLLSPTLIKALKIGAFQQIIFVTFLSPLVTLVTDFTLYLNLHNVFVIFSCFIVDCKGQKAPVVSSDL